MKEVQTPFISGQSGEYEAAAQATVGLGSDVLARDSGMRRGGRSAGPFLINSRQRAERSLAAHGRTVSSSRFRPRPFDCAQDRPRGRVVKPPQRAVRALLAGSALAPARRASRNDRGWR